MKIIGIKKRIDKLGRIVLPKDMRELYGIDDGDSVEMIPTEEGIVIRKTDSPCEWGNECKCEEKE